MRHVGVLLFEEAEELDYAGPWEVLAYAAKLTGRDRLLALGEELMPLRSAKGLRVVPDTRLDEAPPLDVLVVPGGQGRRRVAENPHLLAAIARAAQSATWVTSVCTGSWLLHVAGPARGKRVTTHHAHVAELRERGDVTVLAGPRYVRDGNLVTAAGVSAGIDMALWLVGQRDGLEVAREVQRGIQYDPAPPYTAEV
jgi:transcriptional regulator GlxA family with amidase domain